MIYTTKLWQEKLSFLSINLHASVHIWHSLTKYSLSVALINPLPQEIQALSHHMLLVWSSNIGMAADRNPDHLPMIFIVFHWHNWLQ